MSTPAEFAPAPAGWGVPVPDGVDDVTAAAIVNPGQSSWVPLHRLLVERPDATVLIHGATGVSGLLAVQIAQVLGAGRVVAAGRSTTGLAIATERGADAVIELDTDDLAAGLTAAAPDGVDIVIDYLWGERTATLVPALLRSGRDPERPLQLVETGSMAGTALTVDSAWLRSRPLRLSGSGLGSVGARVMFAAVAGLLDAAAVGRLTVDAAAHPPADVAQVWHSADRLVLVP